MFEHNTVIGTQPDTASGDPSRRGVAILASFYSEASLWQNRLVANPVATGAITSSLFRWTHDPGW
jgi:hypothetical protein